MRTIKLTLWCALLFPLGGCIGSSETATRESESARPVYFVADYDPSRSAPDDLAAAVSVAQSEGKRILLQVGGEWCSWCHKMTDLFQQNPHVAEALRQHFVLLKINYSQEHPNAEFLSQLPAIQGYPHLFVLEQNGELLHSQSTVELEEGDSYNLMKVSEFLKTWSG